MRLYQRIIVPNRATHHSQSSYGEIPFHGDGRCATGLRTNPVISIIDDDESVRESMKGLIRSLGYDAKTYRSADDFLKSGGPNDTSCVITDIQMPGTNGLDLQDRLQADGHATPVIFVTAFPKEPARSRAMKAGAYGFLAKPFDEAHLIACLDQAFAEDANRRRTER